MTLEILGLVGFLLAFYALRPVLSAISVTGTGIDGIYGAKVEIVESGFPIRDVTVRCLTNKVIFDNSMVVTFERFLAIDEYSVGSVKSGETFTFNCTVAWSLWEMPDEQVALIAGYPTPGKPNLGVALQRKDGALSLIGPVPGAITFTPQNMANYRSHRITGVDASAVIQYRWPFTRFRSEKTVHLVESLGPEDGIKWKIAPEGEPVLSDPDAEGWKLAIKSNGETFGVIGKGGKYVP